MWEPSTLEGYGKEIVCLSVKENSGYEELVRKTQETLGTADFDPYAPVLATQRQKQCCLSALSCLEEALAAMDAGLTLDAVNVSLDSAVNAFLELTGERATERITAEIFKHFCVGK